MKIATALVLAITPASLRSAWRHQSRLKADVAIAHIALDFLPGHQRGHRVDDHDVDRAGAHQRLADVQRLLAVVRLRDVQLVNIHAQLALAYTGSSACSASMNAAVPPDLLRLAPRVCSASVVLPEDSGP